MISTDKGRLRTVALLLATAFIAAFAASPINPASAEPGDEYAEPSPAPNTTFVGKPAKKTKSDKAIFRFVSSTGSTTYKCKLDQGAWAKCKSPVRLKKLKPGKHTFKVKGTSRGKTEKSPASFTWTVKK